MNFYNNLHPYYCGIDLHARSLYVCILDQDGDTCLHREIPANPNKLYSLLEPYIGNIVVGVECMHCWYWVSDFCEEIGVDFILGHALYMKAIHGGKAKNDRIDSFKIANLVSDSFHIGQGYLSTLGKGVFMLPIRDKIAW